MPESDLQANRQSFATTSPPEDRQAPPRRLPLEPMDPQLKSVQPGGGWIVKLELAWGHWRRWYLRSFRPGYVARMARLRQGTGDLRGHDIVDPRDLKYFRNQFDCHWMPQDDPFAWRDKLPFARAGLAELVVFSIFFFGTAALCGWLAAQSQGAVAIAAAVLAVASSVVGLLIVWFFRDPHRTIPAGQGLVVSPADGKVVAVIEVEHDEFLGGPAVLIEIFLSIFNVHINRAPASARVIGLRYRPGKYLNALRPESARENEQLAIRLEGSDAPHRRMVVRQITGAIARRIVCWLKPGDELAAGQQFGMIKLGSRTELLLPREAGLEILVSVGETVQAGSSVLARYTPTIET